jgi:hypothetical protein
MIMFGGNSGDDAGLNDISIYNLGVLSIHISICHCNSHHITHHASRITHHASRITHHASRITHHASRITHHASRITHHASRITHHPSPITQYSENTPHITSQW